MSTPQTKDSMERILQKSFIEGQNVLGMANTNTLVSVAYDAVGITAPSATTDKFEYYTGGLSGNVVATITITYTDSTKNTMVSVVKS